MFAEDLSVFFSADEFALEATFTPSAGGADETAHVIFNSPTEDVFGGDTRSHEYEMKYPATSLPSIRKGDTGTIEGVQYKLRETPRMIADGRLKSAKLAKV